MSSTRGTCEACGAVDRLVGPFRERDGRTWNAMCSPCKLARADLKKVCADVQDRLGRIGVDVKVDVER